MKMEEKFKDLYEMDRNLQDEYEEYIKLRERVDVVVGLIASGEFISKENILRVIGTERALKAADSIKKTEDKQKELDVIKYGESVSGNA